MTSEFTPSIAQVVRTFSISAQTIFREKYPELLSVLARSKRPSNDWDFFMTAAGVGFAIIAMKAQGESKKTILKEAAEVDKQIPAAVENLFDFIEKQNDADIGLQSHIGVWVLWNINGACPAHSELEKLAPAIGMYIDKLVTKYLNETQRYNLPLENEIRLSVAKQLEGLTDRYLEIDKELFHFSWRRLIPFLNNFEAIDFNLLLKNAEKVTDNLKEALDRVSKILSLVKDKRAREEDVLFLQACLDYLANLSLTLQCLTQILRNLSEKTKDLKKYSKAQYNHDINRYEIAKSEMGKKYDFMADIYKNTVIPCNPPPLNQCDVENWELVGERILYFIQNDREFKILKDPNFSARGEKGLIKLFCEIYFKEPPKTTDLIPWFIHRVASDVSTMKNRNKLQIKTFINNLHIQTLAHLEQFFQITKKYKISTDELQRCKNNHRIDIIQEKITDKKDLAIFFLSTFADTIFHLEIIIISHYYKQWFLESYRFEMKKDR